MKVMKILKCVFFTIIIVGILSVSLPVYGVNDSEYNKAIEAYSDVLQGKSEFFLVDNNKQWWSFNDYIKDIGVIFSFAIVDMDGDGIPELITDHSLVLHYKNNIIYGYMFYNVLAHWEIAN